MALPFSTRISPIYTLTAGQVGPFTQSWPLYAAADLQVLRLRAGVEAELVLDAEYSVTGAGSASVGFSVMLLAGAEEGDKIIMIGARDTARTTTYTSERGTMSNFLNLDLNMTFAQLQEMQREVERAFKTSLFDPDAFDMEGLRHTAGKALAESGCSDKEIQSVLGHRTTAMVSLYTKASRQKTLARSAINKLERTGTEQETAKPHRVNGTGRRTNHSISGS